MRFSSVSRIWVLGLMLGGVVPAAAFEMKATWPVALRSRMDAHLQADVGASPYPFDYAAGSPTDRTRLMLDILGGTDRVGRLYLKAVSSWSFQNDIGGATLRMDQGDYAFARSGDDWSAFAVAFVDERRFFTGEYGLPLMDDNHVTSDGRRYGVRTDGRAASIRWTAVVSTLETMTADAGLLGYARTGWFGSHTQVTGSLLSHSPGYDNRPTEDIARGELSAQFKIATAIVAYEQLNGDSVSGSPWNWDEVTGGNFSRGMPENGATFAELRARRWLLGEWGWSTAWLRYSAAGDQFVNPLSAVRPGAVSAVAGLSVGSRASAVDGRLEYEKFRRRSYGDPDRDRVLAQARAMTRNQMDVLLRGAIGSQRAVDGVRARTGFFHAGLDRVLQKFSGGLHAMVYRDGYTGTGARWGVRARVNLNASTSLYGAIIQDAAQGSNDFLNLRLEFRPLQHVYAAFSIGRNEVGNLPYFIEEPVAASGGPTDQVYSVYLRGTFE